MATTATSSASSNIQTRVDNEVFKLLHDIRRVGDPGASWVTFGELFDDECVQQYYEALVGTLKSAKRRGYITFRGQMLLKGMHDGVRISIVGADDSDNTEDGDEIPPLGVKKRPPPRRAVSSPSFVPSSTPSSSVTSSIGSSVPRRAEPVEGASLPLKQVSDEPLLPSLPKTSTRKTSLQGTITTPMSSSVSFSNKVARKSWSACDGMQPNGTKYRVTEGEGKAGNGCSGISTVVSPTKCLARKRPPPLKAVSSPAFLCSKSPLSRNDSSIGCSVPEKVDTAGSEGSTIATEDASKTLAGAAISPDGKHSNDVDEDLKRPLAVESSGKLQESGVTAKLNMEGMPPRLRATSTPAFVSPSGSSVRSASSKPEPSAHSPAKGLIGVSGSGDKENQDNTTPMPEQTIFKTASGSPMLSPASSSAYHLRGLSSTSTPGASFRRKKHDSQANCASWLEGRTCTTSDGLVTPKDANTVEDRESETNGGGTAGPETISHPVVPTKPPAINTALRSRSAPVVVSSSSMLATAPAEEQRSRVEDEIQQLLIDIRRIGVAGEPNVTFGELFDDEHVEQYYEALVGTLKSAKRRGVITFKGQMLLKGIHDKVVISIIECPN